jgi:hypothetical protein
MPHEYDAKHTYSHCDGKRWRNPHALFYKYVYKVTEYSTNFTKLLPVLGIPAVFILYQAKKKRQE